MKRIVAIMLIFALVACLAACAGQPVASSEVSQPPQEPDAPAATPEPAPEPEPEKHVPMDILDDEFNPFGMEWPCTVFAASFDKGSAKWEGKARYVLSMTGSGIYACIAYHADVAGLGLDNGGKEELVEEYRSNGEFLEFTGADRRIVTIRKATPEDDRYEYVESDGNQGFTGAGCVIDITYFIGDADIERYTRLVRDTYSLDALTAVAQYMDVETDFSECGIYVSLYKNEVKTTVAYYVPDVDAIRQSIAANVKSDWWEWNGNQETWIQYDESIGNKLTMDVAGGAITISQERKLFGPDSVEGSLSALGFNFDDAGTCGVYEQRDPHYISVAIARPEWGVFSEDWNIEFMDTDINGYSLRITYHANDGRYHVSVDKDGKSCAYDTYPEKDEIGWEYPDLDSVHRMFNDAFGTKEKELYFVPLEYFEQYVQERFRMSVDELYALPKK